jgi:hypothetical protein
MLRIWYDDNLFPSVTRLMLTSASLLLGKHIGYVALTTIDRLYILYKYGTRFKDRENYLIKRQWRMTGKYVALVKIFCRSKVKVLETKQSAEHLCPPQIPHARLGIKTCPLR